MQLHQITKLTGQKKKKRVGRGGKRGTFSGKGVKGQKSRAGRKLRPEWRDFLKSLPKRRGYAFVSFGEKIRVFNVGYFNRIFKDGDQVTPAILVQRRLIAKEKGRLPAIKILGDGELNKKINFSGFKISASARQKIEKAGGTIK